MGQETVEKILLPKKKMRVDLETVSGNVYNFTDAEVHLLYSSGVLLLKLDNQTYTFVLHNLIWYKTEPM